MNKERILQISLYAAVLSTMIAVITAIGANSSNTIARALYVAGAIGLLSIGSFVVGTVYPKGVNDVSRNDKRRIG